MDTHTKQIFLSGIFVYVTTVSGLVFNYSVMQENHSVRIDKLEIASIQSGVLLKSLAADMGQLRTKSASVEVMLDTLNKSVVQLSKTTIELGKIAARLDERSRNNKAV